MEPQILVAYATRYGSTEQTARVVASVLAAEGLSVDVRTVEQVQSLEPYSAVVVTAAIYIGRLHKKARRFLKARRAELERVPVALIVAGPVTRNEKDWTTARTQLDRELARMPWLRPVAQKIVGGKWDPAKLGFIFRWTLRNVKGGDARDWPAIRKAARELAGILQPAAHSGANQGA